MMDLKDYDLAKQYFEKCMNLPGAPDFTRRLYANALYKRGDLETSWQTWLEIYNTAPDERTKKIASNHLYQVKSAIDTNRLKDAVGKFRERAGRLPAELADLVRAGILDKLPQDLDGQDYVYDPKTGERESGHEPMETVTVVLIAVFGLVWGSFLNVVIYRVPRGLSLLRPPSSCPGCGARIKPYDNVPVLSYLILRGKCRKCGRRISPVYPTVEALTALAFILVYAGRAGL